MKASTFEPSNWVVLLYGSAIVAGQTLLFRAALQGADSNELVLGLAFSVWLLASGAGSLLGRHLSGRGKLSLAGIALAVGLSWGLLSGYLSRTIFGKPPGVTLTPVETLLMTVTVIGPSGVLAGALFPLVVNTLSGGPARLYGIEALGSFFGGLGITVAFIAGATSEMVLGAVVLVLALMVYFAGNQRGAWLTVGIAVVAVLVFPETQAVRVPEGYRLLKRTESAVSEVLLVGSSTQKSLFYGGHLYWSYPSPEEEELPVHTAMALMSNPGRVLLIGGSPGTVREILRYNPERVFYLEPDPAVLSIARDVLNIKDRKVIEASGIVRFVSGSAREFIHRNGPFDVVLLNIPPPETASMNRFFTGDFFTVISSTLTPRGVVLFRVLRSPGYMPEPMVVVNASVYRTVKGAFTNVLLSSPDYGLGIASNTPVEVSLKKYKKALPAGLHYFYPELIKDMFLSLRAERFRALMNTTPGPLNTPSHPVAFVYNLALWAERAGVPLVAEIIKNPIWIYSLAGLLVAGVFIANRKRPLRSVLFSAGAWSMGAMVLAIMLFQSYHGLVYEKLGLLSGFFMLGLFGGTSLSAVIPKEKSARALISVIVASGLLIALVVVLRAQAGFYLFCLVAGLLTALEYSLSVVHSEPEGPVLYGMELLGASLAAAMVGVFLLPLQGLGVTIMVLLALQGLGLVSTLNLYRS